MRRTALMFVLAGLVGALVAVPIAVYASHQFTDVPNTNPFHDDIDWLADSGVTLGCGTNIYCPKDNVTREQMAAFMYRLGTNRVVDAGELEGFQADELAPRAVFNQTNNADDGQDLTLDAEITAPAPGIILVVGGVEANSGTADRNLFCRINVNSQKVNGSDRVQKMGDAGSAGFGGASCETNGAIVVEAGTHTVQFQGSIPPIATATEASVWALWVPFGGTGNTP